MAYWWVSQNQTYRHERNGGFLWAPVANEEGKTYFHWATMKEVQPGDLIFSYVGGKIVAVAVAKTAAYDSPRPGGMGEGLWEDTGRRVDVEYRDLSDPIVIASLLPDLQPLMPERYAPLNRFGTGNQGYLFGLPPRAGRLLLDLIGGTTGQVVEDAVEKSVPDKTERRALVLSRLGQGVFRESLMSMWGGRCAVTGLDLPLLLLASHIKPWRDSDNSQRLDPFNGLLLSPDYDAIFDVGLISFEDDGGLIVSPDLTADRLMMLGIERGRGVTGLDARHRSYLAYHRREVFSGR